MQSEVDLDDEVKKLLVMAGSPELYPVLVVRHCMAAAGC